MYMKLDGLLGMNVSGQPRSSRWTNRGGFTEFLTGDYDVEDHLFEHMTNHPLPLALDTGWVAPFATCAGIVFVPVLRCLDGGGIVTTVPEQLEAGTLANHKALIIQGDLTRQETIHSNTTDEIVFQGGFVADEDDWVIVAPDRHFALMNLLLIERNFEMAIEWRNWVFDGVNSIYSYTGNPFANITSVYPVFATVDFTDYVSPLATGLIGSMQAFTNDASTDGAALYIGRDTSNHVIASVSADRSHMSGDGGSAPFRVAFGANKTLAVAVSRSGAIGRTVIYGWTE